MKQFKPSALSLALMLGGLHLAAIPSYALAADAPEKNADEEEVEVIQVTGFKGSIIKALNTKRFSDTVVDAISADDIGGLPDVSIADSLTRVPGVTSVRIDGQSSELNVRGLSGGFVSSTLNGREMVSTSGGRAIQFDMFPSELMSGAQVYKSQKASLIEGGVAATINLDTVNALDMEDDHRVRASLHGNYNEAAADNPDSGTIGRRLTLAYQGKFFDETLGFSIGWANMFQPTVSSRFVNYEFGEETLSAAYDGAPVTADGAPLGPDEEALTTLVSSGFEINERGGEDERNAFTLALNYEPTDSLRFAFDAFYSKFNSEKWDRGLRVYGLDNIGIAGVSLSLDNPLLFSNGTFAGGDIYRDRNAEFIAPPYKGSSTDMGVETQSDDNTTISESAAFGLKTEWDITDDLMMTVDFAHSQGEEEYKDQVMVLSYFEDNSVAMPVIDDDVRLSYQLNGLNIPNISFNQDYTDQTKMMLTSVEKYPKFEENSSDAVRVDFKYQLDNDYIGSVEFGARYSQRDYELSRGIFVYGLNSQAMREGNYVTWIDDGNGGLMPDPAETFAPLPLTAANSSAHTLGGELSGMPSFLTVDNDQVIAAWIPGSVDQTPKRDWANDWTMTQGNLVEEDVMAVYAQANIDTEFFGVPLTGNFGVRYVDSSQSSTGLVGAGGGNGQPIADDFGVIKSDFNRDTVTHDFTDVLPSLNLNFQVTDNDQVRFAYAKVMARAEMPKMANSGNWGWSNQNDAGRYQIDLNSSTSPTLEPFYADQYDLSFEHYFTDTDGALILAFWYKDIKNMVGDGEDKDFDYEAAGFIIPPTPADKTHTQYDANDVGVPGTEIDYVNGTYYNADNIDDAGYMRGIELGYTQTFGFLPSYLAGLGASLNYSYTQSEIKVPTSVPGQTGTAPIEGLSPNVISTALFYQWEDFSARLSGRYRSAYLSRQIAIGSDQSAFFQEETIISAQASYNFMEGLQGVISVDNLTDEPNLSYYGQTESTGTIQYFGRTIYFGVNYTM